MNKRAHSGRRAGIFFTGRVGGQLVLVECFECCFCNAAGPPPPPPGSGNLGFPALAVLGGPPPSDRQCALGLSAPLVKVGFTGWSGEWERSVPFQCKPQTSSFLTWKPREPDCIIRHFICSLSEKGAV